jgi:serine/threonine-protein kinase
MIANSLAHYRITAKLGEGGMGEVYRATDAKLGREVAIKVLPSSFSRDPQSLARFEREAKALASLNHPHIAAIHGFDADQGTHFLVLELVEGETLTERLRRGPLPAKEAMTVARQIAEALQEAHEKGIVHRDLKPGNVKITPDGHVKVLDFGLAKIGLGGGDARDAGAPEPEAPTMQADTTLPGAVMGTPAYMSPEQATGRPVDKRADIWAFGVVLYEMVTGRRLFPGDNVSEILAGVIKAEVDLSAAPPPLRYLLQRCLEKSPKDRLRDIGDYHELLRTETSTPAPVRSSSKLPWFVTAIAAAIAVVASVFYLNQPPRTVWTGSMLGTGDISISVPRLSPDGTMLAFNATDGLYPQVGVMKPQTGDRLILTHETTKGYLWSLSWSADGSPIYYDRFIGYQPFGIYSVPAFGGGEHLVLENAGFPDPLPDGTLMVERLNEHRKMQVFRYWPDTGKLQHFSSESSPGTIERPSSICRTDIRWSSTDTPLMPVPRSRRVPISIS